MRQQNIIIIVVVLAIIGLAGAWMMMERSSGENKVSSTPASNSEPKNVMEGKKTIVDIAAGNPDFSTLVTAVKAAGLVDTLSQSGPFTVFAPTNAAFAKLPKATLDAVLADKEQLTAILTYHVVPGKVMAKDVIEITSAKTVQGGQVDVNVSGNTVTINNATVLTTDIEASNGVIHVIDTVLIPK